MKTLYLDIFSGISGDMFIGAMLDLGVPFEALRTELEKLDLGGVHVHATRQKKQSIEGVKFDVHDHDHDHDHNHDHDHGHGHGKPDHHHEYDYEAEDEHQHGRTFSEIQQLIRGSSLSPWVKDKAIAVFKRIARAEGKIHGKPADQVHFHEVGAVDSIVDIVGAAVCLEWLGKPRVISAPVTEGTGWIQCAHGRFPIPAPATIAILAERGVPVAQCEEPHELVTPTGAAILAEFAEEFAPLSLIPERIGYGAGQRNNRTRPNLLRAVLGRSASAASGHDWETDTVAVLETNLDDTNAEILGYVVEKSLAEGALDVFHTPVQMKKNRPGVLLTVLCATGEQDRFTEFLLRETTALGVRRTLAERRKLRRDVVAVRTEFGGIEVKTGTLNGRVIQASPEFESCKRAAQEHGVPLKTVYQAAMAAASTQLPE